MSFGCFVDIYQQDGTPVRMHYAGLTPETRLTVAWIGIQEETARKFKQLDASEPPSPK